MSTQAGSYSIDITADTNQAVKSIDNLDNALAHSAKTATSATEKHSTFFKDTASSAMGFLSANLMAGFGAEVLKTASYLEKAGVAMNVMIGDAAKSKQLMADLQAMGAATPFESADLIAASKTLLTFGYNAEAVIPILTKLGDASQGDAQALNSMTTALGRMKSDGVATLEELNKFTDAGVNIMGELAKKYNVTAVEMKKMVSSGKVGFAEVEEALTKLTTGTGMFSGMMAKMSETLAGKLSTLNDDLTNLGIAILEEIMPAIQSFIAGVTELISWFKGLNSDQKDFIKLTVEIGLGLLAAYKIFETFSAGIQAAKIAFMAFNTVILANPVFLAIGLVAIAVGGLISKMDELEQRALSLKKLREIKDNEGTQAFATQFDSIWNADGTKKEAPKDMRLGGPNNKLEIRNEDGTPTLTTPKYTPEQISAWKKSQKDIIETNENWLNEIIKGKLEAASIWNSNGEDANNIELQLLDQAFMREYNALGANEEAKLKLKMAYDQKRENMIESQSKRDQARQSEAINFLASGISKANEFMGAAATLISKLYDKQISKIEEQKQAALRAAGLADKTAVESAQKAYDDAVKLQDQKAIDDAKRALDKAKIEEEYDKKKRKAEYDGAMVQWKLQQVMAITTASQAALSSYANAALWGGPIAGTIAAAAAIAFGGIQLAIIKASKPEKPAFELGGFVPGGLTSGDQVDVRANSGEAILNATQQRNFMALANGMGGGSKTINLVVDGKVLASVVDDKRQTKAWMSGSQNYSYNSAY